MGNAVGSEEPITHHIRTRAFQGRNLTEIMNETHMSPKYLPGVSLGDSTVAVSSLIEAVADADVLVFCTPHQFVYRLCKQLVGKVGGSLDAREGCLQQLAVH